jgi:tRNA threonylcarbamoyladenosine biosynthesis protein TsaE
VIDPKTQILATATFDLANEAKMIGFGKDMARLIKSPMIITMRGDLGAGKTTLSRGVLQGLGHRGNVKSPTYTLVEPYELEVGAVYHFDLYRMVDPEELEYMGFADYLLDAALCLIEWPERGEGFIPLADISISIGEANNGRCVTLQGHSNVGRQLVEQLVESGA